MSYWTKSGRTHDELKEALAAFALDALDPIERIEVKEHLEVCAECDALLREYLEVAAQLAMTADPEPSPERLRVALLDEARSAGQMLPIGMKRNRWFARSGLAFVSVAIVIVAGVMLLTRDRFSDDRFVPEVVSLLASPSVHTVPMASTDAAPGASGQIYIHTEGDSAAVVMTGLDNSSRNVYQLWVSMDGASVAVKQFQADKHGKAVVYVPKLEGQLDGVRVTLESSTSTKDAKGTVILRSF